MGPIELLVLGLVGFFIVRSFFGPHWMKARLRSHMRDMRELQDEFRSFVPPPAAAPPSRDANCPACGAPVGEDADVSPSGDVKCNHCGRWLNVPKG